MSYQYNQNPQGKYQKPDEAGEFGAYGPPPNNGHGMCVCVCVYE